MIRSASLTGSWNVHFGYIRLRTETNGQVHAIRWVGATRVVGRDPGRGRRVVQSDSIGSVVSPSCLFLSECKLTRRTHTSSGGRPSGGSFELNPRIEITLPQACYLMSVAS